MMALGLAAGCHSSSTPKRTLVTRPLMPTSPLNLLRDPFIGGDRQLSYGQFEAVDANGNGLVMTRSFQSVSPVHGAVSIEQLANPGFVLAAFYGGPGNYHASIWVSAVNSDGSAAPFDAIKNNLQVSILDNEGTDSLDLKVGTQEKFGGQEWVQFVSSTFPMLTGGWFEIDYTGNNYTLQMAAPEVTTDALGPPTSPTPASSSGSQRRPMSDRERRAIQLVRALPHTPPRRHLTTPLHNR